MFRYVSIPQEITLKIFMDLLNCVMENLSESRTDFMDEDRLSAANMDWMRKYKGSSKLLLQPRSTEEVSQILKYCNSRCLAVVPQGGNTGLVGGSVPVFDEVIINIGSMNNIISFDKVGMMHFLVSGILVCEAGCILENLISFVDNQGIVSPMLLPIHGEKAFYADDTGCAICNA
ncbi:D-2-hydroxyglutarate dehydrogenase, mitochondrial [Vitis vinifera]|uniref:D-2-hydroxyglutarate dehydrogenase, mitochondrial n=1 Tax=Vitis vinifera TaxID=29760 RepID=A0A438EVU9_VITVI|nr:D-2-hydroxyglutarate dehydrogenase, mitochondrial [Vitis vinifera]